jgi:anti-anti-sigma regulatory factor
LLTTERSWVPVKIAGEVDIATASGVLGTVLGASKAETAGIFVDVSGVTFMGAAGHQYLRFLDATSNARRAKV